MEKEVGDGVVGGTLNGAGNFRFKASRVGPDTVLAHIVEIVRNGEAIQAARRVDTVVLDKTGTITQGTPSVVDVDPAAGLSDQALLEVAALVAVGIILWYFRILGCRD